MYIEKFHNQNRSFSRGSTPSANSNHLKQFKAQRLNNSLNKISQKPDKEDQILKDLQSQLIGQYDQNDNQDTQQRTQNQNSLRQLFIQQNTRENTNPSTKPIKPPIDNAKISRERQKLNSIYNSLYNKSSRKTDQRLKVKRQEFKQTMAVQDIVNSNLFKEQLNEIPQKNEPINMNKKSDKNYCFYDTSYYQNYMRNSPPVEKEDQHSSKSSSFYSQMGGRDKAEISVAQIQIENIDNIRTITSSNNINNSNNNITNNSNSINKQEISMNPSFYNNKSKFVAMLHNKSNNSSFSMNSNTNNNNNTNNSNQNQNHTLNSNINHSRNSQQHKKQLTQQQQQQQFNLLPYTLQHTQNKSPDRYHSQLSNTSDVIVRKSGHKEPEDIINHSILKLEQNQQNPDPLSQIDELKQIMLIEQQNISKILNKGNKILQPKLNNNSSFQEAKTSFYSKQDITISDINKEGLLGAYDEYNKMNKHEIIEKLLVSEHIMKQLYKKTKLLQEQMQQMKDQQKN